ncbi:50S ribosomal protein L11 methyltransferase [Patescibacteria group bacterium]|nr:50S ribosomal protein L11 methyltransferase [Patescibacteria group bacterium]
MQYIREQVWCPLSELILDWDDSFHHLMLNDKLRMSSYKKAIFQVVKSGMTVVDIGTGTGILSLWALQSGAQKVYGIEMNEDKIHQAKARISHAGFLENFEIFNALSFDTIIPERVDLVLSEILGNLGDNENMTPILADARNRFLKSGGAMLPMSLETLLVPVSSLKAHEQIRTRSYRSINEKHKLIMRGISDPFNLYYDCILPRTLYLSTPQIACKFNFDGNDHAEYAVCITFVVTRNAALTGFKGSFMAKLCNTVAFDITGDDIEKGQTSDCLKHCFLPINPYIEVKEEDIIDLVFSRSYPRNVSSLFAQVYSWKGTVYRKEKAIAHFKQTTEG